MPDNENEGINLSGAHDDSGTGVKFEDSGWSAMKYYHEPQTPKIIQWTMKYSGGLIKNEKQANYVLLGFVALAIIVSLFLIFGGGSETPPIDSTTTEDVLPH